MYNYCCRYGAIYVCSASEIHVASYMQLAYMYMYMYVVASISLHSSPIQFALHTYAMDITYTYLNLAHARPHNAMHFTSTPKTELTEYEIIRWYPDVIKFHL